MRRVPIILCLAALLLMTSCSPATSPSGGSDPTGSANLGGDFDGESFVLYVIDPGDPDEDSPLHVELIGSDLVVDPVDQTISLQVAIHNLGEPLFPALMVWLSDFLPPSVTVQNPDVMLPDPQGNDVLPWAYGFDYSELLGEDGVLSEGEISGEREWIFGDPGLLPFSFAARLEAGLQPNLPRIEGRCFVDENRDGMPGPGEPPLHAEVLMVTPAGEHMVAFTGPEGRYSFPVFEAGLYGLHCFPLWGPETPPEFPWHFTTPNPLSVILPPGPEGLPEGFHDAHFGAVREWQPLPPVRFTDLPPDSLHFAPWTLIEAGIHGDRMDLHLGFSGCQPEQPFTLWISGGFMESWPVQVNAVLVHDVDEDCDAWWQDEIAYDLTPLRNAYLEGYGEPGLLLVNLIDFQGAAHQLEYAIGMWDSIQAGPK